MRIIAAGIDEIYCK